MIHLLTWIPLEYQQSLCREFHEHYGPDFMVWFAERAHRDFPFKSNAEGGFASRYLCDTGYSDFFRALRADPDAVVVLGGWRSPMTARVLAITTLLRVPVFIWADHPHPRKRGIVFRALREFYLRGLNLIVAGFLACGEPTVEHLVSLGLARRKIRVFPYWTELPERWSLPAGCQPEAVSMRRPLKLIAVGRLSPVKQFNVAIEAVGLVNRTAGHTIAELDIAGDGPERASLEEFAREQGASACVTFLGWLEAKEIRPQIEKADLLLITSAFEGYGVVALEAMAAGRAVLASDVVIAAIDRDEGTGAIVFHQVGNARDLAEQIRSFAADRERLYRASVAARATAEKWPPSRAIEILGQSIGRTSEGRRLIERAGSSRSTTSSEQMIGATVNTG
jgi:glycosyltransferase involved in cell wall biosynthesis